MCNLINLTKRKKQVIYKLAYKIGDKYYSPYAFTEIKLGKVEAQTKERFESKSHNIPSFKGYFYEEGHRFYNKLAVGRCSGFERLKDANQLLSNSDSNYSPRILRLTLRGSIAIGNALNLSMSVLDEAIVFAGSEIVKIEEVITRKNKKQGKNNLTWWWY